jgi:hypothetical protein
VRLCHLPACHRRSEAAALAELSHALHGPEAAPEVEVSDAELAADPTLAAAVAVSERRHGWEGRRGQRRQGAPLGGGKGPGPAWEENGGCAAVLRLNLQATAFLLRHHPDEQLREQASACVATGQ